VPVVGVPVVGVSVGGFTLASVWRDREKGDIHMTEQASLTEQIVPPTVEEIYANIPHKGVRDLLNDAKNTQRRMNSELEDIETEWDMEWDNGREVWIDRGGYAYDASRFGVGTRSGSSKPRRNGDA